MSAERVWKPHLTVAAVIEDRGRFLLVEERAGGRLVYNQPAGHVEEHETFIDAVVRETLEETAWVFEPRGVTGVYLWRNPDNGETFCRVGFFGKGVREEPGRTLDGDIVRALWLDRDQIAASADRLRSPLVMQTLDDYLHGARYPLDVIARSGVA
ncbi:MAG TPA: NUDIX hydrolase [Gammaproteobacteria bacterium]|nr:NUDIX hydrolase [Gammaproteobacteria bacterium]